MIGRLFELDIVVCPGSSWRGPSKTIHSHVKSVTMLVYESERQTKAWQELYPTSPLVSMLQLYQIGMKTVCAVQQLKVIDDTLKCSFVNALTPGLNQRLPWLDIIPSGLDRLPFDDLVGEELINELEVVWLKICISF